MPGFFVPRKARVYAFRIALVTCGYAVVSLQFAREILYL